MIDKSKYRLATPEDFIPPELQGNPEEQLDFHSELRGDLGEQSDLRFQKYIPNTPIDKSQYRMSTPEDFGLNIPTVSDDYQEIASGIGDKFNFEKQFIRPTFEAIGEFVGTKPFVEESVKLGRGEEVDYKRMAGGAASTALLFFPAATVGKAAQVLTKIPMLGSILAKASTQLPKIAKATKFLGTGAAIGAAEAAKEGGDVMGGAEVGAETSAVLGAGINILGAIFRKIPQSLTKRLLRLSRQEIKKAYQKGEKTVADRFLNERRIGSYEDLYTESSESVKKIGKEVQAILKPSQKPVSSNVFAKNVAETEFAKNAVLNSEDIIELVIKKVPETKKYLQKKTLTIAESNRLRQLVDETIGDKNWLQANPDKLEQKILKEFANDIRKTVQASEPETQELFSDLADEIKIRNALLDRLAQGERGTITLSHMFGVGGSGAAGAVVAGVPGMVLGAGSSWLLGTPQGQQALAISMNELRKAGMKITPFTQNIIIKTIQDLLGKSKEQGKKEGAE